MIGISNHVFSGDLNFQFFTTFINSASNILYLHGRTNSIFSADPFKPTSTFHSQILSRPCWSASAGYCIEFLKSETSLLFTPISSDSED